MKQLLVATRKGLFQIEFNDKGSSTSLIGFEGDPVIQALADPRDGSLYASLDLGHFGPKLQRSRDGGSSWEEVSVPSYPKGGEDAPSLKQIWSLELAGERAGELWAGTTPGGLFHSADAGQSWTLNRSLWDREERSEWFGGGFDVPGIHSICVDPRRSDRVALGISCGGVWLTEDGGGSWQLCADGMYAAYMPEGQRGNPNVQDPHLIVQSPSHPDHYWCQHHNGIFRSRDNLKSWEDVPAGQPSCFGFAVAVHPLDPETAWFVPAQKDECRVPAEGKVVVSRTRDGGKNFEVLRSGLPQENAYDLTFRHALVVDPTGDVLAFGSTTGSLWVTRNGGAHWQEVHAHLPPIYALRWMD